MRLETKRGVSLIIAVFAMMLLAVLGWTLVNLQSTDFEANLRNLDSERALNLAEAGAEWTLQSLNLDGSFLTDSNHGYPLGYAEHSISPGQYRVSCVAGSGTEAGLMIVTSSGYTPRAANYNIMRQVRLAVAVGSLTNAVQTQIPSGSDQNQGLFDWHLSAQGGHTINIEGNILAGHYEGNGNGTPDELNQDYGSSPLLPPDLPPANVYQRGFTSSYPSIAMNYFYTNASNRWPPAGRTVSLQTTVDPTSNNNNLKVPLANFFTNGGNMQDMAVHNITKDLDNSWSNGEWAAINNVNNGTTAQLDGTVNTSNWRNDTIKLARRFYDGQNYDGQRWYAGRQVIGGETADTIIDSRNGNVDFRNTSIISEGNIVLKGNNRIRMRRSGSTTPYPNLATQNGDIISLDQPGNGSETTLRDRRRFSGLIYSENGKVSFKYLNGVLVYGKEVTLDGTVLIQYASGRIVPSGFVFSPAEKKWQEQ